MFKLTNEMISNFVKVLACDKGNLKAKQCKIVCKIQMGQVDDALKEIAKATNADVRLVIGLSKTS